MDVLEARESIYPWRAGLFGIGGVVLASIGVVLNVLAIVVLARFRNKHSAPFLLICLAVCDILYLIFMMVDYNLMQLSKYSLIDEQYRQTTAPFYCATFPIPLILQTTAAYLVVVITLERYIVVNWPFKATTFCSLKLARLAVCLVVILGVAYNVPHYMAYYCRYQKRNGTNREILHMVRSGFGGSYTYNEIFMKWLNMTVNFLFPFAILVTLNILTIHSLRKSSVVSTHFSREKRLTLMIICMTGLFFFFELFAALSLILVAGADYYETIDLWVTRFTTFADTMMMVNAAANFAIYCASGQKFRDTLRKLLASMKFGCLKCLKMDSRMKNHNGTRAVSEIRETELSLNMFTLTTSTS